MTRLAIGTGVVAAALATPAPTTPQPACSTEARLVTELGTREQVPDSFTPIGGGAVPYPSPEQPGARYVRVRFTASSVPACPWYFNVRDPDYRPVQVFGPSDFTSTDTRWTRRVAGRKAIFDLQPCPDGQKPEIKFNEYVWMPAAAQNPYYSLQTNNPAFAPITQVNTALRKLGDPAGLLVSSWLKTSWVCSGVMITKDLFLTNWHCGAPPWLPPAAQWNADILRDTIIDLSFDGDDISRELTVSAVAATSEPLDFAILRTAPLDYFGPNRPVKIAKAALDNAHAGPGVQANQPVRIAHHPAGKTKQLSWNCTINRVDYQGWREAAVQSEFTHLCDTEGGSSGAGVLDERGELVGLHHLGFDYDQATCRNRDHENKAVKITAILGFLRANVRAVYDEVMQSQ
jgi:V8-like Glu-specific endopeptidase